jgi:hypothetical protein
MPPLAAVPAPPPLAGASRLSGAIAGTLASDSGAPFVNATVVAIAADGKDAGETTSDDEGFFLLPGLDAGRYMLFPGLGSPVGSWLPARAVSVASGAVTRVKLRQFTSGATIRVRPVGADGQPLAAQAVLVSGAATSPATVESLLSADAILLPEQGERTVLRRVPAGVYSVVILQGADVPPQVAKQQVTVREEAEQAVDVRLPAGIAAR